MLSARSGAGGVSAAALEAASGRAWAALEWLRAGHAAGAPLMRHAFRADDLAEIGAAAAGLAARAAQIVVLGTGGSSLGAKTLYAAARSGARAGAPVAFVENADPQTLDFRGAEAVADCAFVAVSKSGETAETLAAFAHCWTLAARALGPASAADRFLVVTGPAESPLRRLAVQRGIAIRDHEPDTVGRMSILADAGLLPAAMAGVDIGAVRLGARRVAEQALGAATVRDCPPALGAAAQIALIEERGAKASIVMPYADRLAPFARWYCQLWAESLGKAGCGSMPYPARGMVDQHSQLQFWLAGPALGSYTLIDLPPEGTPVRIDDPGLDWLNGRSPGALMQAAAQATAGILAQNGRPVRRIRLQRPGPDAETVGALAMHFMLETAIAGHMLGIDPFDQPAVDAGKALMREILSKSASK